MALDAWFSRIVVVSRVSFATPGALGWLAQASSSASPAAERPSFAAERRNWRRLRPRPRPEALSESTVGSRAMVSPPARATRVIAYRRERGLRLMAGRAEGNIGYAS